jgi:predicted transport protein
MPIFRNSAGKLRKLNAQVLDKEKNLQQLLEANLREVLDLQFLATEYVTTFGGRIDTLAVDSSGAPVIIEYKRNKNDNVINQALSYLKWLKTQKQGFFEKLMIDKLGEELAKRIGLDWANPRVICIAESYSKFDIDTVEVVPLRIELLRFRYYEDGIFSLEPVNVAEQTGAVPGSQAKTQTVKKTEAETGSTVDDIVAKGSPATRDLFGQLRERILALDETITEKATSLYVAYKLSNNFAEVYVGKGQIKIHLRPIDYEDSRKEVEKIPEGYNWTMNRRIYLKSLEDLDYVLGIIEQSYKDVL